MSNFSVIAAILIAASLTVHVSAQMGMSPSSEPSGAPEQDCMTNLLNMSSCLSYVQAGEGGGPAKPEKACCPALAGLVESSPKCLCYLLSGNMASQFGLNIDKGKALKLPGVCKVVTPDPSLCSRAESPGGFASGPSAGRASNAQSNAPYSLFLNLIIFPLAFALYIYC